MGLASIMMLTASAATTADAIFELGPLPDQDAIQYRDEFRAAVQGMGINCDVFNTQTRCNEKKEQCVWDPDRSNDFGNHCFNKAMWKFRTDRHGWERTMKKFVHVGSGQRKVRDSNKLTNKLDNVIVHF